MQEQDRIARLKLYYKNAPTVAGPWITKQINKLNSQLLTLRSDYKNAETPEKKKQIQIEGEEIKKEIELYKSIPAGVQMVGAGSQTSLPASA